MNSKLEWLCVLEKKGGLGVLLCFVDDMGEVERRIEVNGCGKKEANKKKWLALDGSWFRSHPFQFQRHYLNKHPNPFRHSHKYMCKVTLLTVGV